MPIWEFPLPDGIGRVCSAAAWVEQWSFLRPDSASKNPLPGRQPAGPVGYNDGHDALRR
ncbi:MAG: hypothetical protein ACUVUC_07310 [Thermoguttaceae bacterium]